MNESCLGSAVALLTKSHGRGEKPELKRQCFTETLHREDADVSGKMGAECIQGVLKEKIDNSDRYNIRICFLYVACDL